MNLIKKLKDILFGRNKQKEQKVDENGKKVCNCKYCKNQAQPMLGKYSNLENNETENNAN